MSTVLLFWTLPNKVLFYWIKLSLQVQKNQDSGSGKWPSPRDIWLSSTHQTQSNNSPLKNFIQERLLTWQSNTHFTITQLWTSSIAISVMKETCCTLLQLTKTYLLKRTLLFWFTDQLDPLFLLFMMFSTLKENTMICWSMLPVRLLITSVSPWDQF